MKRKFLVGASFSALMLAAMAPWSASHANGVSVRVSTPEFGIRIGAPHFPVFQPVPVYRPVPVYQPVPVYHPRPYRYAPPAVIYTPPPRWGYGYSRLWPPPAPLAAPAPWSRSWARPSRPSRQTR